LRRRQPGALKRHITKGRPSRSYIVGTGAGDLYDLYARAVALFMGKYLPGNPSIIVQNMPGAGHMIAANYIYTVAKPDGLTLGG
jgi:tripartite-type tricarboxylate transporter receptor subunit TctC